jgi:hypothetical protein
MKHHVLAGELVQACGVAREEGLIVPPYHRDVRVLGHAGSLSRLRLRAHVRTHAPEALSPPCGRALLRATMGELIDIGHTFQ